MTIPTLHVPQKDSPQSTLATGVNDSVTTLALADSSIFEADGVTRLTLGLDQSNTETVTISSYDGNNEITVVRGSPAYSWPSGTLVARVLNSDDIVEIQQYLEHLNGLHSDGSVVTNGNTHDHSGGDGAQIPEGGISNGAITANKIGSGAVVADKLGSGSVTANKLANNAVTEDKLASGAVSELKLLLPYIFAAPTGRLTLASGVPLSFDDQTGKTTLYYTPYNGNVILLYVAGAWKFKTFAELSLSLSGYVADKNYDIWMYDNSGTPTLESTVWTNDTTRATALAYQDGILVKSGDPTRRYLGTIRITGTTGQCEDSNLRRFVWNMYNRHLKQGIITGCAQAAGSGDSTNKGTTRFVTGDPAGAQIIGGISGNIVGTGTSYAALYLLYDGNTLFTTALVECGWGSSQSFYNSIVVFRIAH